MIELKETFGNVSFEDWVNRLKKDLKSEDLHELKFSDEIEELEYISYNHADNTPANDSKPGDFPYTRNFVRPSNDWRNAVEISDPNDSSANAKALDLLMKGADALIFELYKENDLNVLLSDIGLQYIHTTFITNDNNQIIKVLNGPVQKFPENVSIGVDPLLMVDAFNSDILEKLKVKQVPFYLCDGYHLQQCGATITQQLAFMLSSANECMLQLINAGFTADQASACIHFKVGIGSNYFMEIAKIRSLRTLWSNVVKAYQPLHNCSYNCRIIAATGSLNKSAKDPHTNLLRQTTEAMSAIIGGVEILHVAAHDSGTTKGTSELAERMAMNISLILREESYLDKVIDPLGGSYTIEELTENLTKKAWHLFQEIDSSGGIMESETRDHFLNNVKQKGQQRLEAYRSGMRTLIGVNKFPNPKAEENSFLPAKYYLGIPEIIFERDI